MNSSASNATASEKTIPPTTAMNVIAICMMSLRKTLPLTSKAMLGPNGNRLRMKVVRAFEEA